MALSTVLLRSIMALLLAVTVENQLEELKRGPESRSFSLHCCVWRALGENFWVGHSTGLKLHMDVSSFVIP